MSRSVFVRIHEELHAAIAGEAERLGMTFSDRARALLVEAVSLRQHTPPLPRELALALCQAYWSHYFGEPAIEAQALLGQVEDALALGEVERETGDRLLAALREIPGPLHVAIAGRLRDALMLVREHDVPVELAIIRAGLAQEG